MSLKPYTISRRQFVQASTVLAITTGAIPAASAASQVQVLCSSAMIPIMRDVLPQYEKKSGDKVAIRFLGTNLKPIIEAGEFFDLAISQPDVIDSLIKQSKIAAGTGVAIARQGMGVGVRAGTPKPDISSVEAFRQTMLNAKAVAYAGEGRSGVFVAGIFVRLGIADEMKRKSILYDIATGPKSVIDGKADLVITVVGTILGNRGLELAGPLPPDLQVYSELMGGIGASAKEPGAAKSFLNFLTSPTAAQVIRANGMEPIAR